jgi:hypothetical protein
VTGVDVPHPEPQLELFDPDDGPNDADVGPPEPLPITPARVRVPVATSRNEKAERELLRILEDVWDLTRDHGLFSRCLGIWQAVLDRHTAGEEPYMEAIAPWSDDPETMELVSHGFGVLVGHFWLSGAFADLLGPVYEEIQRELQGDRKMKDLGQFLTPWNLCIANAEMVFAGFTKAEKDRLRGRGEPLRIQDPCIGSGSMVLAMKAVIADRMGRSALRNLKVYGQDLDPVMVRMAIIQTMMSDGHWMTSWMLASTHDIARDLEGAA